MPKIKNMTSKNTVLTLIFYATSLFTSISYAVEKITTDEIVASNYVAEKKESNDLAAYKELSQARLESVHDLLQKDIQAFSTRVDVQDKRLDTQNVHIGQGLSLLGVVLTVIGLIIPLAGLVGYFSVSRKARKEAKNIAEQWFAAHNNELQIQLDELRLKLDKFQEEAKLNFSQHAQNLAERADVAIRKIQLSITESNTDFSTIPGADSSALTEAATAAKNKPESKYTYKDWNNRAFDAYSKGKIEHAARFWHDAANDESASPIEAGQALLNAGNVLISIHRYDEAIASFNEVIERYGQNSSTELKLITASALSQKIGCLGLTNRFEESSVLSTEIIERFKKDEALAYSEQMARVSLNRVVCLERLGEYQNALKACTSYTERFDQSLDPAINTLSILVHQKRFEILWSLEKFSEATKISEEILARIDSADDTEQKQSTAKFKNTIGFRLICHAKQFWNDTELRNKSLLQASILLREAMATLPESAIISGNLAYCGHLLDHPRNEVRDLLSQTLTLGGQKLYDLTLEDLLIHPVNIKDDEYKLLLDQTWAHVSKSDQEELAKC